MAVKFATIDSAPSLGFKRFSSTRPSLFSPPPRFTEANTPSRHDRTPRRVRTAHPVLGATAPARSLQSPCSPARQNSTLTGTLAGQIVGVGFNIRPPWLRCLHHAFAAIVPAAIVAAIYGSKGVNELLILSQVILSLLQLSSRGDPAGDLHVGPCQDVAGLSTALAESPRVGYAYAGDRSTRTRSSSPSGTG